MSRGNTGLEPPWRAQKRPGDKRAAFLSQWSEPWSGARFPPATGQPIHEPTLPINESTRFNIDSNLPRSSSPGSSAGCRVRPGDEAVRQIGVLGDECVRQVAALDPVTKAVTSSAGCRVTSEDLGRLSRHEQGPRQAVVPRKTLRRTKSSGTRELGRFLLLFRAGNETESTVSCFRPKTSESRG